MLGNQPIIGTPIAIERRFERAVRRVIFCILVPFLLAGAIASYRACVQVRRLDLHVDGTILRAGVGVRANAVCSGRVPVTLTLELVQGERTETLAARIVPGSKDPFFDPRTVAGTLSVSITPEMLAGFEAGAAIIRATARGRPQWLREPPPLIRIAPLTIE